MSYAPPCGRVVPSASGFAAATVVPALRASAVDLSFQFDAVLMTWLASALLIKWPLPPKSSALASAERLLAIVITPAPPGVEKFAAIVFFAVMWTVPPFGFHWRLAV